MIRFRRTASGLDSQHLFYKVDLIVYLEGGISYNKSDVYVGKYTLETEDKLFWENIFKTFIKHKKIKFKSIGSKTTIKEIALDIQNIPLNSVLVAMDNEFDEVLKNRIEHPKVYYTYGYSWENDIWSPFIIKKIIEDLTANKINHTDIEQNFDSFLKSIKVAVNADGYLFKKGKAFFPRKSGHLFCVECTSAYLPTIKKDAINTRLSANNLKRSTINSFGRRKTIDTSKFCYGHLLADYCAQVIIHYLKNKHSLGSIPKDIIYRMGISKLFEHNFTKGTVFKYYENQFKEKPLT